MNETAPPTMAKRGTAAAQVTEAREGGRLTQVRSCSRRFGRSLGDSYF